MCAVSAIMDYGRGLSGWDIEKWKQFQRLIEQAKQFDKQTGQPDCEDPKKEIWVEEVKNQVGADQ